jgi:hypothetical protein
VGNLHLRFDEGRAGHATRVSFSPTLPPLPGYSARREERALLIRIVRNEFRPAIPRSGWSPPEPPSRPGEFHPEPLTDPCLSLSTHTARATP